MPGRLSEVTQKLSSAAEEYNQIDQEHQAQVRMLVWRLRLSCFLPRLSLGLPLPSQQILASWQLEHHGHHSQWVMPCKQAVCCGS